MFSMFLFVLMLIKSVGPVQDRKIRPSHARRDTTGYFIGSGFGRSIRDIIENGGQILLS